MKTKKALLLGLSAVMVATGTFHATTTAASTDQAVGIESSNAIQRKYVIDSYNIDCYINGKNYLIPYDGIEDAFMLEFMECYNEDYSYNIYDYYNFNDSLITKKGKNEIVIKRVLSYATSDKKGVILNVNSNNTIRLHEADEYISYTEKIDQGKAVLSLIIYDGDRHPIQHDFQFSMMEVK